MSDRILLQEKITGTQGQVLTFDSNHNIVPVNPGTFNPEIIVHLSGSSSVICTATIGGQTVTINGDNYRTDYWRCILPDFSNWTVNGYVNGELFKSQTVLVDRVKQYIIDQDPSYVYVWNEYTPIYNSTVATETGSVIQVNISKLNPYPIASGTYQLQAYTDPNCSEIKYLYANQVSYSGIYYATQSWNSDDYFPTGSYTSYQISNGQLLGDGESLSSYTFNGKGVYKGFKFYTIINNGLSVLEWNCTEYSSYASVTFQVDIYNLNGYDFTKYTTPLYVPDSSGNYKLTTTGNITNEGIANNTSYINGYHFTVKYRFNYVFSKELRSPNQGQYGTNQQDPPQYVDEDDPNFSTKWYKYLGTV